MTDKLKYNTGLMYGMDFDQKAKQSLRYFAQDFGIENVPRDEHLALPIAVITEIDDKKEPTEVQEFFTGPVYISDFSLVMEKIEGRNVLLVEYESPIFESVFEAIRNTYGKLDQGDKEFDFVLSQDAPTDLDLDHLTFEFNNYMPYLTANEDISGFYSLDDIDLMMLGEDGEG